MNNKVDYLVLGSGLSSLSFSALMAQKKSVKILECHEHFGGYGHTFAVGDYRFNSQLHYVPSCGKSGIVYTLLSRLGLEKDVTFNLLNSQGYDRVYCGDKQLHIPYGYENLQKNMKQICPQAGNEIQKFIQILMTFEKAANNFPLHFHQSYKIIKALPSYIKLFKYRNATLQDIFDECHLPKILQTLVAGQLIDYMLPPKELSFFVWAALFNAYNAGAYYPTKHFENVVDSLVKSIQDHGGELCSNEREIDFITEGKT
ncbi:MAG: NAD(P)-binding protein, partial [Parachlamydiaceae bacterium]|nr:NAD(P)-binding protein [Parachlamydiaceae bacterium]